MIRTWFTKPAPALACAVLIFAGFGCTQNGPNGTDYLINAARPGAPAPAGTSAILEVRRFSVDAEFASRGLVYRTDEFEFDTDAYRRFLIPPAQMITERTRNWLSLAGLFDQVLVPGSRLRPTHVLEGNVLALYGDLRDPDAPVAVLEMRCFLITESAPGPRIVLARNYGSVKPILSSSAEGLVAALDACLAEILANLETHLADALAEASAAEEAG